MKKFHCTSSTYFLTRDFSYAVEHPVYFVIKILNQTQAFQSIQNTEIPEVYRTVLIYLECTCKNKINDVNDIYELLLVIPFQATNLLDNTKRSFLQMTKIDTIIETNRRLSLKVSSQTTEKSFSTE